MSRGRELKRCKEEDRGSKREEVGGRGVKKSRERQNGEWREWKKKEEQEWEKREI